MRTGSGTSHDMHNPSFYDTACQRGEGRKSANHASGGHQTEVFSVHLAELALGTVDVGHGELPGD